MCRSTWIVALIFLLFIHNNICYEKTLRKIVRNQSKMIQTPFSDSFSGNKSHYRLKDSLMVPGYTQVKAMVHKNIQRPKISAVISTVEIGHNILNKPTFSRLKIGKYNDQTEQRMTRNTISNSTYSVIHNTNVLFPDHNPETVVKNFTQSEEVLLEEINKIPAVPFFQPKNKQATFNEISSIYTNDTAVTADIPNSSNHDSARMIEPNEYASDLVNHVISKEEFIESDINYNISLLRTCANLLVSKVDINAQEKFLELDVEPPWLKNEKFWNNIYNNRYEFLMRNPDWPSLKVILIPRTHVDTIWLKSFETSHNESVQKIITNVIKKLQFYPNLTFTWNEVSHLSYWWKNASQKRRVSLRRLIREGRLEITTGGWVETDEATSSLFGILHQFTEGHQWLDQFIKYKPKLAWLTNSVTHSPTFPYILSAIGISEMVFTKLHFAFEEYFAEFQYSDFIWLQNWDNDKQTQTDINLSLNKIGIDRYPKHAVLTHFIQFNSDGFKACGPDSKICGEEYNFANKVTDVNPYNIKDKAESLLQQYSKSGTLSPHNIIMAPIGGPLHFESQTEFDYQYNNYLNIADFINVNQNIYKATVQFGTPSDYFKTVTKRHKTFPTLSGDFMNFAEINKKRPAYWTGFFTSRPMVKILLRRLQATLRSTEILFSFTSSLNAFRSYNKSELISKLIGVRESVARLQDRNVVSGTLPSKILNYLYNVILKTVKDCWYIQEVAASLLSTKPDQNEKYLTKYVYKEGEFISSFKSIEPGDQLYVFNSFTHERTEVVELLTRHTNIRMVDHNKKDVSIQINPVWKYSSTQNVIRINNHFFKVVFVVIVPSMTMKLYKFKEAFDISNSLPIIYCTSCVEDSMSSTSPFSIQPIELGDIQIENYKLRLIFDEFTGFLKSVIEKGTSNEKQVVINYGAFRSSDVNSGIYLFNTNVTKPIYDILKLYKSTNDLKSKIIIIVSGNIVTDFTSIYGNLLQHNIRICNSINNPLSGAIRVESKVDFDVSPNNRDLEMFMLVQTDIENGNPAELHIDNNGFQFTSHKFNTSRRIESNMFPLTNLAFIQDEKNRLSIVTDHAHGVTALQEGQILVMLDRRVLFNDGRGVNEGLADNRVTNHVHYILLENLVHKDDPSDNLSTKSILILPSLLAIQTANILTYPLDIFFIDKRHSDSCHYVFLPLCRSPFPCDVFVLNFRMFLGIKSSSDSALLTLHRQGITCQVETSDYFYCSTNTGFNIERVFQHIHSAFHTNLVGTTKGIPISDINNKNFPSMELMSLKISFN
ncbi:alpha-mannosidase 2-like [Pieris brassicae]|uniref:alpha-mannosidase 2-like n=1 Tax=Pieris brassicae TaxID=7116 RepID=UPI001E65ED50|nr:alpha-mannosidase 2-like [Pieris brassicae]